MIRPTITLAILAMLGCGSDTPPPSCQQAFTHYYDSGCVYRDAQTGATIPLGDAITGCIQIAGAAPARCLPPVDDWLRCLDAVPAGSTMTSQCDCSQEQMSIVTCQ